MNLEDLAAFRANDPHNMIDRINNLPQTLHNAWEQGLELPLPAFSGVQQVVLAGMGRSAAAADVCAAYCAPASRLPVVVLRAYDLPAWARGPHTLVIALSESGETEETHSVFEQALFWGCSTLVIAGGGRLASQAASGGTPVWTVPPGAGIGFPIGLLLAVLHRIGAIASPAQDLREALHALRNQQTNLLPEVPVSFNPAKRMAGQLIERWVTVFAAEPAATAARYWKDCLNTLAKAWAQFDLLPEADHNSLAGLVHPESGISQMVALFLVAPSSHPRNQQRLELTRQAFMVQGVNTDFIQAKGETALAHVLTLLHFGEYTAYYLAMAYQHDPSAIEIIDDLKNYLRQS